MDAHRYQRGRPGDRYGVDTRSTDHPRRSEAAASAAAIAEALRGLTSRGLMALDAVESGNEELAQAARAAPLQRRVNVPHGAEPVLAAGRLREETTR
jgi:hypothetical protein